MGDISQMKLHCISCCICGMCLLIGQQPHSGVTSLGDTATYGAARASSFAISDRRIAVCLSPLSFSSTAQSTCKHIYLSTSPYISPSVYLCLYMFLYVCCSVSVFRGYIQMYVYGGQAHVYPSALLSMLFIRRRLNGSDDEHLPRR